ncbi:MAG: bifunctional 4-hydroxy-2-oxoglutarate aldolase/2-dehydro-3-deoxy-phosphogluconate aldolase, partial [Candidatus Puniceispirillaceae bacterium]
MTILDILKLGPVMPVIVIDSADQAEPLADALLAGGIRTAEITLRTPAAIKAIEKMARNCPDITVGAGTVRTARDAQIAADAGSRFVVSPGTIPSILEGCQSAGLPLLPGAASVSEMMALAEQGYSVQKFFPANAAGGISFIKSLSSPLPDLTFCPTGGIT